MIGEGRENVVMLLLSITNTGLQNEIDMLMSWYGDLFMSQCIGIINNIR